MIEKLVAAGYIATVCNVNEQVEILEDDDGVADFATRTNIYILIEDEDELI